MKRLFLSSSFADVKDLFLKFSEGGHQGKIVAFIPTASIKEEVTFYVAAAKEMFSHLEMIVSELEISTASCEEITKTLKGSDYIYISGGNTFFLLQELKRTGADKIITEQINEGKIYIGESAGSMILAENIEYAKGMDDFSLAPDLEEFMSLGVIDFYPLPHYKNFPFEQSVDAIISKYKGELDLCPISNNQAIIVNENKYKVWSSET